MTDRDDRPSQRPSKQNRPQAPSEKPDAQKGPEIPEKLEADPSRSPAIRREADDDLDLNKDAPRHTATPQTQPDSPERPRGTGLAPHDPEYQG